MVDAKCMERWQHTSALLATLININRDPRRGRAVSPSDLNPYTRLQRSGKPGRDVGAAELADIIAGKDA